MSRIFGSLRHDATQGEQKVLALLKQLPDDYYVWPELAVDEHNPDFVVVHPQLGVAVLEVKDWFEVIEASLDRVTVLRTNNQTHTETNPDKATRTKAIAIADRLRADSRLTHRDGYYSGRSRVPWAYAVIFANINRMFARLLNPPIIGAHCGIFRDDLVPERFEQALSELDWPYRPDLTAEDVDLIRGALYPELRIGYVSGDGRIMMGVADVTQEQVAREGLHDRPAPREEAEVTREGQRAAASQAVRLVRGPAGSGKTLVLILRAKYLAQLNPHWRILVVAFNRALAEQLKGHFDHYSANIIVGTFHQLCQQVLSYPEDHWGNGPISDHDDRIRAAIAAVDGAARFGPKFLSDEIKWMKEVRAVDRERYLDIARFGRGRPLSREERDVVYQVYRVYQDKLDALRRFDWDDAAGMVLAALEDAAAESYRYDAILVDEAQDFAPVWFDVLRQMLNPGAGSMFMAADGAQRIYRHYSWRSLGLDVVGRSRVLRHSYRNTYEIAQVAAELLRDQPSIHAALKQEEDEPDPVVLEERWMRHGPRPVVFSFNKEAIAAEQKWLANRVQDLLREGFRPEDIAVFARETTGVDEAAAALRAAHIPVRRVADHGDSPAVAVGTMHAAKGLEFRAVFVMRLDQLFRRLAWQVGAEERRQREADEFRLLYVAMTRARDRLFFEYRYPLPQPLEHFIAYVKRSA